MSNTYLLAVDAVSSGARPGIGVGFVIVAPDQSRATQPAFVPSNSRRAGLVLGISCAIGCIVPSLKDGDRIEVQLCTDPDLLLKSDEPSLADAIDGLNATLVAVADAGAEVAFGKADAREAPCLAQATQQAATGLLCHGQAVPA